MKKIIYIAVILLFLSTLTYARTIHVILYCNFRTPVGDEIKEHWKPEIPDVGVDEVIRNFGVLAKQGTKRLFLCLVDTNEVSQGQFERIKSYIENFNSGKPINEQILYWSHSSALGAARKLWADRTTDPFIQTIIEDSFYYPVRALTGNEEHPIKALIKDARDVYGLTIEPSVLEAFGKNVLLVTFYGK
jgi:hypothetical protein